MEHSSTYFSFFSPPLQLQRHTKILELYIFQVKSSKISSHPFKILALHNIQPAAGRYKGRITGVFLPGVITYP